MGEIIAQFVDGRLLVQEDTTVEQNYLSGGVKMRIGHVKTVTKVLSIDAYLSGRPQCRVLTPLSDVKVSGDTLLVVMRRGDLASGGIASGLNDTPLIATGFMSAITSGINVFDELLSGRPTSGIMKVLANVIGY